MKKKRQGLSPRTRFEVFKRDSFKCQYCGAAAPDVLLHVDHVKAVSDGGTDDLLNLVTACRNCNLGKSDVALSDDAVVKRQAKQLSDMAERREQIAMMVEWRDGLAALEREKAQILCERINEKLKALGGHRVNEQGEAQVAGWLKRFGMEACLTGIENATTTESAQARFNQMEQYAAAAQKVLREPELREFWSIRALLRAKRIRFGPDWVPVRDMRAAFKAGVTIEEMREAAQNADDYAEFIVLLFGSDA